MCADSGNALPTSLHPGVCRGWHGKLRRVCCLRVSWMPVRLVLLGLVLLALVRLALVVLLLGVLLLGMLLLLTVLGLEGSVHAIRARVVRILGRASADLEAGDARVLAHVGTLLLSDKTGLVITRQVAPGDFWPLWLRAWVVSAEVITVDVTANPADLGSVGVSDRLGMRHWHLVVLVDRDIGNRVAHGGGLQKHLTDERRRKTWQGLRKMEKGKKCWPLQKPRGPRSTSSR
ncbi:hypothetical protein IWZ01DRAFT_572938 [Phyllosticta capitalensis]